MYWHNHMRLLHEGSCVTAFFSLVLFCEFTGYDFIKKKAFAIHIEVGRV